MTDAVFVVAVGLGALAVYFVLSNLVEFAWNFAVAGYKNTIDDERSTQAPQMTISEIVGYRRGHTTLQADAFAKPYISRTFTVSGSITDISTVILTIKDGDSKDTTIFCWFAKNAPLHELSVGERVTIRGRLSGTGLDWAALLRCEIARRWPSAISDSGSPDEPKTGE
jgi:hypothetical protein